MGVYKYECLHENCDKLAEGIRKCKDCNKVIITDRGIEPKVSVDWEG